MLFNSAATRPLGGSRLILVYICLVSLGGCSANAEPELQEWIDGAYQLRPINAYQITGKRDGATTRANAMLTLANGQYLHIELKVDYDPQPVLGAGRWRLTGTVADSGSVDTESLKFLGGQSEGPSLGGRFRLQGDGRPRYRVVLPLRLLARSQWQTK